MNKDAEEVIAISVWMMKNPSYSVYSQPGGGSAIDSRRAGQSPYDDGGGKRRTGRCDEGKMAET